MSGTFQSLGQVGLAPRGNYSTTRKYFRGNVVTYNGSSFCSLKEQTGVEPSNDNVNWMLMANGIGNVDATGIFLTDKNNIVGKGINASVNLQEYADSIQNVGSESPIIIGEKSNYEKLSPYGVKEYDDTIVHVNDAVYGSKIEKMSISGGEPIIRNYIGRNILDPNSIPVISDSKLSIKGVTEYGRIIFNELASAIGSSPITVTYTLKNTIRSGKIARVLYSSMYNHPAGIKMYFENNAGNKHQFISKSNIIQKFDISISQDTNKFIIAFESLSIINDINFNILLDIHEYDENKPYKNNTTIIEKYIPSSTGNTPYPSIENKATFIKSNTGNKKRIIISSPYLIDFSKPHTLNGNPVENGVTLAIDKEYPSNIISAKGKSIQNRYMSMVYGSELLPYGKFNFLMNADELNELKSRTIFSTKKSTGGNIEFNTIDASTPTVLNINKFEGSYKYRPEPGLKSKSFAKESKIHSQIRLLSDKSIPNTDPILEKNKETIIEIPINQDMYSIRGVYDNGVGMVNSLWPNEDSIVFDKVKGTVNLIKKVKIVSLGSDTHIEPDGTYPISQYIRIIIKSITDLQNVYGTNSSVVSDSFPTINFAESNNADCEHISTNNSGFVVLVLKRSRFTDPDNGVELVNFFTNNTIKIAYVSNMPEIIDITDETIGAFKSIKLLNNCYVYSTDSSNILLKYSKRLDGVVGKPGQAIGSEIFTDYKNNRAEYPYSTVFGEGTFSTNKNMTVVGKYNKTPIGNGHGTYPLFVVGNGESDYDRNNALEVNSDGTVKSQSVSTGSLLLKSNDDKHVPLSSNGKDIFIDAEQKEKILTSKNRIFMPKVNSLLGLGTKYIGLLKFTITMPSNSTQEQQYHDPYILRVLQGGSIFDLTLRFGGINFSSLRCDTIGGGAYSLKHRFFVSERVITPGISMEYILYVRGANHFAQPTILDIHTGGKNTSRDYIKVEYLNNVELSSIPTSNIHHPTYSNNYTTNGIGSMVFNNVYNTGENAVAGAAEDLNSCSGIRSVACGRKVYINGNYSFGNGLNNIIHQYSTASAVFGKTNDIKTANYSIIAGQSNIVKDTHTCESSIIGGTENLLHGNGTTASCIISGWKNKFTNCDNSIVTGVNNIILSSTGSIIAGSYGVTNAAGVIICGYRNHIDTNGNNSIIGGQGCYIKGYGSIAQGNDCKVYGNCSQAFGIGSISAHHCQMVIGKYNLVEGGEQSWNYPFIIGNGNSDTDRKNIFTIDWGGNVRCNNGFAGIIANAFIARTPNGSTFAIKINDTGQIYVERVNW